MRVLNLVAVTLVFGAGGLGLGGCNQGAAPSEGASAVHGEQTVPAPTPAPAQAPSPVPAPSFAPAPGNGVSAAEPEIRAAILSHLQTVTSLNVQSFDTDVTQVRVQGDHAQAQVDFRVKNGQGVMQFAYQLEKRDGNWTVTQSTPLGAHQQQGPQ